MKHAWGNRQPANAERAQRNAAWVRDRIARRGWTEPTERLAALYAEIVLSEARKGSEQ